MFYLNNGDNRVVLTLYEKTTQVQPYYAIQLTRKGSFDEVIFAANDFSWAPWYWTGMTVSVVATASDPTNGIITINNGEYDYSVYEMATSSNIDIANYGLGIIEVGICIVNASFSSIPAYNGTITDTIIYYNNNNS